VLEVLEITQREDGSCVKLAIPRFGIRTLRLHI
jgi:hypothetical protein